MEHPFNGDRLVPKNPAPLVLFPETGDPKRFEFCPKIWNSPPDPAEKSVHKFPTVY